MQLHTIRSSVNAGSFILPLAAWAADTKAKLCPAANLAELYMDAIATFFPDSFMRAWVASDTFNAAALRSACSLSSRE